ncbi:MAG: dermonecrotic toxin domain-containing protein [Pseudomonas sp.]|uniref:dermonecrotic toxin domain-containing protein n=1 Tax=Pseudomonas sp. TaxID=306 RepID=UPI003D6F3E63
MNAVIDSSPISRASQRFDQITQQLTKLAEASSGCQQVLAQSQAFREWASELLRERIRQFRPHIGLRVSNPDAIFFNRRDSNGSISSMAMTDVLIDAMRNATPVAEVAGAGFHTRHATLDRAHALTGTQNRQLIDVINKLMPTVSSAYEKYHRELWQRRIVHPVDTTRMDTPARILSELQRQALLSEIELLGLSRAMSVAEQSRLSSVVLGSNTDGVFALFWRSRNGRHIPLPSVYVITQSTQPSSEPSGVVFLVLPCRGIERVESIAILRETLSRRLTGGDPDQHFVDCMPLSDQGRLTNGQSIAPDAWEFTFINRPLLEDHMQSVQRKQEEDLDFLMQQPELDDAGFHAALERVQLCSYLDDALGHRFNLLSVRMEAFVQPEWRKYAKQSDQMHLLALEERHRALKSSVAKRLAGVESFVVFAHSELIRYIRERLGCTIDPSKVMITLQDNIRLGTGQDLNTSYRKSLFEFAIHGMPNVEKKMVFEPATDQIHVDFSEEFVTTMVAELNLHRRYSVALRQAYENPDNLREMVLHRDSAIALSAFAASMQGHMIQDRSRELLSMIRADKDKVGSSYSIGSLYLLETHTRFNDFIVFADKTQSSEHFVLYAPGAPGGQDFFEFSSWRQLCFGVGEWLATDSGRSYIHDQLASSPSERGHSAVINDVQLKPSLWGLNSCLFVRCQGDTFERNLADLVSQKVSRALRAADMAAPQTDNQTPFASLSVRAVLDARIEALNAEFVKLSPGLIDFRSYVHQQTSRLLNDFLRSAGYTRHVDPDTLYLGLGLPRRDNPEFGEHSELHQLTQLMMEGSKDILSYRPRIHLYSSTGLDVTALPVRLIHFMDKQIRGADMGAKYMDFLEETFLKRGDPLYARRKLLMAKRVQYDMTRGALKEFMRGRMDESQYAWVRQTINGLDQNAVGFSRTSSVSAFRIANQIIEGVFIFRDFSKSDPAYNLLYTPNSPDGIDFRPVTDYAQLLESAEMQNYCYRRVAYMGQPMVGTFLERLQRGGKFDERFIRIVNRFESRIIDAERLYGDMIERMIADVDAQTVSLAEARLSTAWTVIQWLGNVLLVPFPAARISWGIFTSAVKVYQGVDAYISGDRATALPLLLEGVMGIVSGGNKLRKLFNAAQLAATGVGVPVGVWIWSKREFESKLQKAVNEHLQGTAKSLIFG